MGKEDYVSLEVAKLLKEKGFDKRCEQRFVEKIDGTEREGWDDDLCAICEVSDVIYYPKPTLYEAQKWLRSKKIYVLAQPAKESGVTVWYYQVVNDNDPDDMFYTTSQDTYPNYETALNEGIKYALNSFEL